MNNLKLLKNVAVGSLILLAMVAFALGFYPLEESAARAGIAIPVLLPVLIDVGLVLMGLGAMAARANRLRAWPMRIMAGGLILVSACVQYFHAISQPNVKAVDVIVAVLPPIVLWAASSAVESLVFGSSVNNAVVKAEQAAAKAAQRQERKTSVSPVEKKQPTEKKQAAKPNPAKHSTKTVTQPISVESSIETALAPIIPTPPVKQEPKISPVKTTEPKPKQSAVTRRVDELPTQDLQDALASIAAGASISGVAKQYGVARASLARRVEKEQVTL